MCFFAIFGNSVYTHVGFSMPTDFHSKYIFGFVFKCFKMSHLIGKSISHN